MLLQLLTEVVDSPLNRRLEALNGLCRKKVAKGATSESMKIMAYSAERHVGTAKHASGPSPFFDGSASARVEVSHKRWVVDMQFVRIDAHNRTLDDN